MFTAEPIDAERGPSVHLLWMTADPLAVIAAPSKMYKGEVARSLRDVTHAERREYVEQLKSTKLKAPYEFVKFHFLIEGVTRAFTHQMVRQRTAVYAQESLRFAVKSERGVATPVGLPPSLVGTVGLDPEELPADTERQRQRDIWENALVAVDNAYSELIERGMPAEDARGLLPHNTLTRLHYCTDLRALLDHAGNRLCTQAQFEWRLVFAKIAEAIREYNPYAQLQEWADQAYDPDNAIQAFVSDAAETDSWQYSAIADLFAPVCYQTGKCEFKANFDRKCSIRDRVDAYHERGVSSEQWDKGVPGLSINGGRHMEPVLPIFPAEWLLNPGAAR
jgi:flavin-dependent thymidylate synthase